MMGENRGTQGQLFYEFGLEAMVPQDHLLRKIDAVLDLSGLQPRAVHGLPAKVGGDGHCLQICLALASVL